MKNCMSMGEPHAHMGESVESLSSSSLSAPLQVQVRQLCEPLCFIVRSGCTTSSPNHRLDTVCFLNPLAFV